MILSLFSKMWILGCFRAFLSLKLCSSTFTKNYLFLAPTLRGRGQQERESNLILRGLNLVFLKLLPWHDFQSIWTWDVLLLSLTTSEEERFCKSCSSSCQTLVLYFSHVSTTWQKFLYCEVWCLKPDQKVCFLLSNFTPTNCLIMPSHFILGQNGTAGPNTSGVCT